MSLVGNLEDLSLPDILQIVSLSKKSGVLTIEKEGSQGKIFIREGRVIQTISPRSGKSLGEILSAKGMVGADELKKALEIQRSGEKKELLSRWRPMIALGMPVMNLHEAMAICAISSVNFPIVKATSSGRRYRSRQNFS